MRVEAYSKIQQMYKTNTVKKEQPAAKTSFSDQLQISSMGKDIQAAKQALENTPDIREEMTAPIKSAVKNGTYEVSGESFAEKIFQKYNEMR